MTESLITRISKFLSLILRHQPEKIGITLDNEGWANVNELIEKSKKAGIEFDLPTLQVVVKTNNKKRFAFNPTGDKIRASQGHSVKVELGYSPQTPPDFLFHGTAIQNLSSILEKGLEKRTRQHVHLSSDKETAKKVGQRHGEPVVLTIMAKRMQEEGSEFYFSANGVWLTEHVPPKFIVNKNGLS